jgi:hypothetical protein
LNLAEFKKSDACDGGGGAEQHDEHSFPHKGTPSRVGGLECYAVFRFEHYYLPDFFGARFGGVRDSAELATVLINPENLMRTPVVRPSFQCFAAYTRAEVCSLVRQFLMLEGVRA